MPLQPLLSFKRILFLAIVLSGAAGPLAGVARGEQPAGVIALPGASGMAADALEHAFWVCDHTATVHGVDATPIAACTRIFEALKQTKFNGDFGELLAWWQQNRAVEYTKLEAQ